MTKTILIMPDAYMVGRFLQTKKTVGKCGGENEEDFGFLHV